MTRQTSGGFFHNVFVQGFNKLAMALMDAPVIGGLVRRGLVTIRYVGRRSGKTFAIPVGYRRSGDSVVIAVSMPDAKQWWRNFLGEGGTLTLIGLDGRDRSGHAVARRDDRGRVSVTVELDTP
jgi:hypothetical protein